MLKIGDATSMFRALDAHRWEKSTSKKTGGLRVASAELGGRTLDVSWLPAAAKSYNISANIDDYVINEVPIVAIDLPNRNLDEFNFDDMMAFNHQQGRLTYKTFIGKPTHQEHDNTDPLKAKGVHFDAQIQQDPKTGMYHIVVLAGWDRTKDSKLADRILEGSLTSFSMGAFVDFTRCSHPDCDATSSTGHIMCAHHKNGTAKGSITSDGYLVYERCASTNFIEMSAVEDPAQWDAHQKWREPWKRQASVGDPTQWLVSRRTW